MALDSHIHLFAPGKAGDTQTLLMLHGTGGDEASFAELGPAAQEADHAGTTGSPRLFTRPQPPGGRARMFDWITGAVQQSGYLGILLLMLGENVFPPIPSELIMPLAGFTAAQGQLNIVLVLLAGTVGSLLGALLWYYIGKWVGCDRLKRWAARHGRWLTISPEDVDTAYAWFHRHGGKAVFVGRLIPAVRTLISVPAGITKMPLAWFLTYTTLGTAIWIGLLAGAGYLLEDQYTKVTDYVNPVSDIVIGLVVLYYLYRVVTFGRSETE